MRYFLTGFMGSGKSFWGAQMATALQIPFVDLDSFIEKKEKQTITKIVETQGELYFRQLENSCLKEVVSTYDSAIIACGGGTPCFFDNKKIMKALGKLVLLEASNSSIEQRIRKNKFERPLIKNIKESELFDFIVAKKAERAECYENYDLKIDTESINASTFAQILLQNA